MVSTSLDRQGYNYRNERQNNKRTSSPTVKRLRKFLRAFTKRRAQNKANEETRRLADQYATSMKTFIDKHLDALEATITERSDKER